MTQSSTTPSNHTKCIRIVWAPPRVYGGMTRSVPLAVLVLLALASVPASAATAPGRVAFSVASSVPQPSSGDGFDTHGSVALPDGGVVMLAHDRPAGPALAVRLRRDGTPEQTFGNGGTARLTSAGAGFRAHHVIDLPDGRLLIAGSRPATQYGPLKLVLVRLLSNGSIDPSFGAGGVVATAFAAQPFDLPMALAPDGSIVLTGALPRAPEPSPTDWVVVKLSPTGAPDTTFGTVRIPTAGDPSRGIGVAVTSAGSIVALGAGPAPGIVGDVIYLVGLTALGKPDPAFNGGAPAVVPLSAATRLHRRADGALDVAGHGAIVRFDAAGALDTTYAAAGVFALDQRSAAPELVALPDGGSLLVRQLPDARTIPLESRLAVQRLTAGGTSAGSTVIPTPFGGGFAGPGKRTAGSVAQNSFRGGLLRRDDGSFVATGRVGVVTPNGKMDATVADFVAAAALTSSLALDRSFGGPQQPVAATVRVRPQRAVSSARLRRIKVRVSASESGLLLLRVRDTRGRLLGGSLQPVYAAGARTVLIPLTNLGAQRLRGARRGLRITVRHEFRDIVAGADTGVTRGRLR